MAVYGRDGDEIGPLDQAGLWGLTNCAVRQGIESFPLRLVEILFLIGLLRKGRP